MVLYMVLPQLLISFVLGRLQLLLAGFKRVGAAECGAGSDKQRGAIRILNREKVADPTHCSSFRHHMKQGTVRNTGRTALSLHRKGVFA
ncbi:hypothetical protein D3C87_1798010 [compost metagenome]